MSKTSTELVKKETTTALSVNEADFNLLTNSPYFDGINRDTFNLVLSPLDDFRRQNFVDLVAFLGGSNEYSEDDEGSLRDPIPVAKLLQANSSDIPDDASPGDFVTPLGVAAKCRDKNKKVPVKFIPLYFFKSRALFNPGELARPVCWSLNAKVSKDGMKCFDCEHYPPRMKAQSNCRDQLQLICISDDLTSLIRLSFTRSSFMIGHRFKNLVSRNRFPWQYYFELTSEKKKNNKGTWFVPEISLQKNNPVDATLHPSLKLISDMYKNYRKSQNDLLDDLNKDYESRKMKNPASSIESDSPSVAGVGSDFDMSEPTMNEIE